MPESGPNPNPDPGGAPGRVQPRRNIVEGRRTGFRKRYGAVGYWALLAVVLSLAVWFVVASSTNSSRAKKAEATAVATLFVAETATAAAEAR